MLSAYAFSAFPIDSSSCEYGRNSVKCSYDYEYAFVPWHEGVSVCKIYETNTVKCGENGEISIYRMQKNGMWIKKLYVKLQDGEESVVRVSRLPPITKWPCLMKDVPEDSSVQSRFKLYVGWHDGDTTVPEWQKLINEKNGVPRDRCEDSRDYIMDKLAIGKTFEMPFALFPREDNGEKLSLLVCNSKDFVTTFRFNKKTGKRERMAEYGGLKPADYCKKFMKTEAIYWKP